MNRKAVEARRGLVKGWYPRWGVNMLAEFCSVTVRTIERDLVVLGLRPPQRRWTPAETRARREAVADAGYTLSAPKLARKFGVSESTIRDDRRWLREQSEREKEAKDG